MLNSLSEPAATSAPAASAATAPPAAPMAATEPDIDATDPTPEAACPMPVVLASFENSLNSADEGDRAAPPADREGVVDPPPADELGGMYGAPPPGAPLLPLSSRMILIWASAMVHLQVCTPNRPECGNTRMRIGTSRSSGANSNSIGNPSERMA